MLLELYGTRIHVDQDRRAVDFNCFSMRGDREGIKGHWSGYEFHLSYF